MPTNLDGEQSIRAAAVLVAHTGDDGMCAGCFEAWARLAPFPCEQRRWAESVIGDVDHSANPNQDSNHVTRSGTDTTATRREGNR